MFKPTNMLCVLACFLVLSLHCGLADMTNPPANEFDVQIVGDSVFDLDGYIHSHLWDLSGKAYKDNSKSGDTLEYVTQQYNSAISNYPNMRTIIMDGGGNDVLMSLYWRIACASSSWTAPRRCRSFINGVMDDMDDLWDDMDSDGIDDIVHLGYYYIKNGTLGNGTKLKGALKYAMDVAEAGCAASPADCWFVDPRADFWGNEADYIKSDGIHPTDEGAEVLADLIWDEMVARDVYR